MTEVVSPGLELGLAELAEGRWEAARAAFGRALEAGEEPGGARGAELGGVVARRRRRRCSPRASAPTALYKRRGDAAGAARMATWLAADQLDFNGAVRVASGWLRRARRLLEPLEPGPEHGWLRVPRGLPRAGVRRHRVRARAGRSAAELGRRFDVPTSRCSGSRSRARHSSPARASSEGMRCLDEATATALEGEARSRSRAPGRSASWSRACIAVRDFERAFEWCDRIAEFAERYGSRYMLALLPRGVRRGPSLARPLAGGRGELEAAVEDFSRSRPA